MIRNGADVISYILTGFTNKKIEENNLHIAIADACAFYEGADIGVFGECGNA